MRKTAIILALGLLLLAAPLGQVVQSQSLGQITSPRDRAAVRGLVPVEGNATHPQFQKYEIHFGPEPNPGNQWTPIAGSPFTVPVVQGRLGLWDTTIIPDGNYDEYVVRGIQVLNTQPTETPTPAATPTPAEPTDTPAPTVTVVIGVPTVASPTPRPTSTDVPTALPADTPVPAVDLPFQNVNDAACWGAGATVAVFVGIGLFFVLKGALASLARWIAQRGKEGLGMYED